MVGSWLNSLNKSGCFLPLEEEQEKRETPGDTLPYWTRTWLCQVPDWKPDLPGRIGDRRGGFGTEFWLLTCLGESDKNPLKFSGSAAVTTVKTDPRAFQQPFCVSCVLISFRLAFSHRPWSRGSWKRPCWRVSSRLSDLVRHAGLWGPEAMKLLGTTVLRRWCLWQICGAHGRWSVCCTPSPIWCTGL